MGGLSSGNPNFKKYITVISDEMADRIFELAKLGATDETIASYIGINRSTLKEHKKKYDAFKRPYFCGRAAGIIEMLSKLKVNIDIGDTKAMTLFAKITKQIDGKDNQEISEPITIISSDKNRKDIIG